MVIYRTSLYSSHANPLSFCQHVYVLWFLDIARIFSCFLLISLFISSTLFTTTKYVVYSVEMPHFLDKPTIGKTLNKTKHSPQKRCEISLQHPPHNSHIYNQLAPSSQIREKWATFVSICLTIYYNNVSQINIHLSNFLSAKALTLCPYLHALVPLLHVNSRTNYCSQQSYFNVLREKIPFFTLSRAPNTPFLHIACLFFSLFSTFSTPVFLSFFRTKAIASLRRHVLFVEE